MKKQNKMECEEIVIRKEQNTPENGYGPNSNSLHKVFADFYEETCFTYEEALKNINAEPGRFTEIDEVLFDNVSYAKRISISIDTLLLEANQRAKDAKKMAFVYVVGLGLGVWKYSPHQEGVFMEAFAKRIEALGKSLDSISDIHFAYFSQAKSCGKYTDNALYLIKGHPNGGIKIFISKREPGSRLTGEHENKLLIVSYAWDGNALPGNEFWSGKLASSGDSSTASSTQISELHNPHINAKVCAGNLRVATEKGLVTFKEYCDGIFVGKKMKRSSSGGNVGSTSKK